MSTENEQQDKCDTEKLLEECNSGTKMAVASIDEVLDKISSSNLKKILLKSREHHEELGNKLHAMLLQCGLQDKEPAPMAKGMSWMKTNLKLTINECDETVADLMTEGCDMGIKSLHRYLNQYDMADEKAREVTKKLIEIEEELRRDLQQFL